MVEIEEYLKTHFPKLELRPPVFYSWDIGIRFQLGTSFEQKGRSLYLEGVYHRAVKLFWELHHLEDDLSIVIHVHRKKREEYKKIHLVRFIRDKKISMRLQHRILPFVFDRLEEDMATHRFILSCRTKDVKIFALLKAISNQDMGLKPVFPYEVFFLNQSKGTIFYIYDDRGCDVIAASVADLENVYHSYSDWILAYDRETIDKVFI